MIRLKVLFILFFHFSLAQGQSGYIGEEPKLAFWTLGEPKEVFIVLHGGPGIAHHYLRPEFDHLKKFGQVIYYDQRATGKSDSTKDITWQLHVKDLHLIKTTLAPDKKVLFMGQIALIMPEFLKNTKRPIMKHSVA